MQELQERASPPSAATEKPRQLTGVYIWAAASSSAAILMASYIALITLKSVGGIAPHSATATPPSVKSAEGQPLISTGSINAADRNGASTMVSTADTSDRESRPIEEERPIKDAHLRLDENGFSSYDVEVTEEQLARMQPPAACSSDGKGRVCFLEGQDNQERFCAFRECTEQSFIFDESGKLASLLAKVKKEAWTDLGKTVKRHSGVAPRQSFAELGPIREMYTCFALSNGSLTFAEAAGSDVFGRPVPDPLSISFRKADDCSNMPSR